MNTCVILQIPIQPGGNAYIVISTNNDFITVDVQQAIYRKYLAIFKPEKKSLIDFTADAEDEMETSTINAEV